MPNMSYCRFQNTATDLDDCQLALEEMIDGSGAPLSREELVAAIRLVKACRDIAALVAEAGGCDVDDLFEYERLIGDTLTAANGEG